MDKAIKMISINANDEVPKIDLQEIKVEELEAYVENRGDRLNKDLDMIEHKALFCIATVTHPRVLEGQTLELGFIQTLTHDQQIYMIDANTWASTNHYDWFTTGKQLLDNEKIGLHPYNYYEKQLSFVIIPGPTPAGSVKLVHIDEPEDTLHENIKWVRSEIRFNLFLIARDMTRVARMRILRTIQWETKSCWHTDEFNNLVYQGPFPPYKQPVLLNDNCIELPDDVLRGNSANEHIWDYIYDCKNKIKIPQFSTVSWLKRWLEAPVMSYFEEFQYERKKKFAKYKIILPLYWKKFKKIQSCLYFENEGKFVSDTSNMDTCVHIYSPSCVCTALVRIPRLLPCQGVQLKWMLARSSGYCYNAYQDWGKACWEFRDMAGAEPEPLIKVQLVNNGECEVSGPTNIEMDIAMSISFKLHLKVPLYTSEKKKKKREHGLNYSAASVKFFLYLMAEDLNYKDRNPHCIMMMKCKVRMNREHCTIEKCNFCEDDLDGLGGTPIDQRQFLVWRPDSAEYKTKVIVTTKKKVFMHATAEKGYLKDFKARMMKKKKDIAPEAKDEAKIYYGR